MIVGIFVGGRGRRLGGVAKGLLRAPGSELTLLERLVRETRVALADVPIVLVGDAAAYAASGLPVVSDEPANIGPLGGLGGLLQHARDARCVLALACDLAHLDAALIARLAREEPDAAALVAHQGGVRNPLIARYDVARALPEVRRVVGTGKRSLQAVLDGLDARLLSLSEAETARLVDWDTPQDMSH